MVASPRALSKGNYALLVAGIPEGHKVYPSPMTTASDWQALKRRVTSVFGILRKNGINARGPVGFDQSEALGRVAAPGRHRGYAFYHSQDSGRARDGGPLWIGFGSMKQGAASAECSAIGREVMAALTEAGLFVQWDGSAKTRLAVHLSAAAAAAAKESDAAESRERATERRRLATDRLEPKAFFASLRESLEGLAREGNYLVVSAEGVDYDTRSREAVRARKTVIACPAQFLPTWDKISIDVSTYPVAFDKSVVKRIAESLRGAGFKVSYVHGSYLHVRTTK
jgi:hypothetical protein